MEIESVCRVLLKFAVLCATASVPIAGMAMPRQGTGTHSCGCFCYVTLGNGKTVDVPANFSLPSQYACGSAEGGVCNVSDPTTGGVRQGKMEACGDGSLHVTAKPSPFKPPVTNPTGGLLQAVPAR
jgi:hypothetical protein